MNLIGIKIAVQIIVKIYGMRKYVSQLGHTIKLEAKAAISRKY